jgi:hypothetical protein
MLLIKLEFQDRFVRCRQWHVTFRLIDFMDYFEHMMMGKKIPKFNELRYGTAL